MHLLKRARFRLPAGARRLYDLCVRVLREVQRVARNGRIAACECAVNEFGV